MKSGALGVSAALLLFGHGAWAWQARMRPLRARARGRGTCYAALDGTSSVELAQSILLGASLQLPDSLGGLNLDSVPSFEGAQESVRGLLESIPSIPSPDAVIPDSVKSQLSQITEALPQATEKLQGLVDQLKGALSAAEEALDGNALTAGVQDRATQLGDEVKGQLGQIQGQLGEAVGSRLGELSSKIGEQTSKALQPYEPLIQDLTGDLSVQLQGLKEATDKLFDVVTEDQKVILTNISPALRVARSLGTPANIFNYENLVSIALWGSLILTPDNAAVKKLMRGYGVVIVAALAYAWLAYLCFEDPVALQGFSSMSELGGLAKGFASQTAVATVWAHLIAGDVFVGRWIYLDGQKNSIFTRHSLLLAFLFGPVGVLSHLFTRGLVKIVRWDVTDIMESGYNRVPPSAAEDQAQATLKEAERQRRKAEDQAQKLLSKAERQADRLLNKAQKEADAVVAKATAEKETLLNKAIRDSESLIAKGRNEGRRLLESAQAKAAVAPAAAAPTVELPPRPEAVMSAETAPQQ